MSKESCGSKFTAACALYVCIGYSHAQGRGRNATCEAERKGQGRTGSRERRGNSKAARAIGANRHSQDTRNGHTPPSHPAKHRPKPGSNSASKRTHQKLRKTAHQQNRRAAHTPPTAHTTGAPPTPPHHPPPPTPEHYPATRRGRPGSRTLTQPALLPRRQITTHTGPGPIFSTATPGRAPANPNSDPPPGNQQRPWGTARCQRRRRTSHRWSCPPAPPEQHPPYVCMYVWVVSECEAANG